MTSKTFKCCICGTKNTGFGNNPWPVAEADGARCCDFCNASVVIPARLSDIRSMIAGRKEERP